MNDLWTDDQVAHLVANIFGALTALNKHVPHELATEYAREHAEEFYPEVLVLIDDWRKVRS